MGWRATLPLARAISDSARWAFVLPDVLVASGRGEAAPRVVYGPARGGGTVGRAGVGGDAGAVPPDVPGITAQTTAPVKAGAVLLDVLGDSPQICVSRPDAPRSAWRTGGQ